MRGIRYVTPKAVATHTLRTIALDQVLGNKCSHNPVRQPLFSCILVNSVRLELTCTQLVTRETGLLSPAHLKL